MYFIADINFLSFFLPLKRTRIGLLKKKNRIVAQASIPIYIVLAKQVPLEVAFEVRLVIADVAAEIRRFTARHFLV